MATRNPVTGDFGPRANDPRWHNSQRGSGGAQVIIINRGKNRRAMAAVMAMEHRNTGWKIAYADFVTALMALFLMLWLLVSTTDYQKAGLADYFEARAPGQSGISVSVAKARVDVPPDQKQPGEMAGKLSEQDNEKTPDQQATDAYKVAPGRIEALIAKYQGRNVNDLSTGERDALISQFEDAEFEKAERELRQALQELPEMSNLARNIVFDRVAEGFRIQLIDQDKNEMFPLGSATLNSPGHQLMNLVTRVINKMPQPIAISGHTDGRPYQGDQAGYSNWELSADRANASRRALIQDGLDPKRIASVQGKADTEHLDPTDPLSQINRRISIVLLRTNLKALGVQTIKPQGSEGQKP